MKAYQTITLKQIIVLLVMIIVSYGCGRSQKEITTLQLQERNGLFYKENSETPYTGLLVEYYPNGQKEKEGTYKDGKPEGPATSWYESGQKQMEGTYKDGKRDGLSTWYENGQKKREGTYKDGEVIDSKSWDKNGNRVK
jgi:antitoxin component YwqK of YwqJK toxin-antitoxin module